MLVAPAKAIDLRCPCCGRRTRRVHSHYMRRLSDLQWQGRLAEIQLHARRFRCADPHARAGSSPRGFPTRFSRRLDARFDSAKATGDRLRGRWRAGLTPIGQARHAGERRHAVADDPRGWVRAAGSAACSASTTRLGPWGSATETIICDLERGWNTILVSRSSRAIVYC